MMCCVLQVPRSGYYRWLNNPKGKRELHWEQLDTLIRDAYGASKKRYGSPRLSKELEMNGTAVSRKTVAKHMKSMGLRSKLAAKFKSTTDSSHKEPVAENILNRDFSAPSPSTKCVSDITYIRTKEGFIYLTTVIDLFNRDIIGWRISNNPAADVDNLTYGSNYSYGDSLSVCNMIYPVAPTGTVTVPQPTDIPTPTDAMFPPDKYSQTYLYTKDANGNLVNMVTPYDASSWVGVGNPQFDNFPLPTPNIKHMSDISAVGHFSFRLSPSSPALGKGTSDAMLIAPLAAIQVTDELLRPSEITLPGSDPGCYQSNGIGNQH